MPGQIQSNSTPREGEAVGGKVVGAKVPGVAREGDVEKVVAAQEEPETEQHEVKNPRKVLFTDDRGNLVTHHPNTLQLSDD